ncbi:MAG: hypothetical protein KJ941_10190 [Bacteroidetes bacterium]|nr:hypothetical protein [Bacteroidota bacterium]
MMQFISRFGFLFILLVLGFTSCKKKCKIPKDEVAGDIVADAIVREYSVGYNQVIRSANPENDPYRVSFDGGYTYSKIDFNEYVLMCQPFVKNCHSQVVKKVTIDKAKARVEYLVTINECTDCEDFYDISNWVLVPKFPETYKVFFRKETRDISEK